jgi:single-strand binding protein
MNNANILGRLTRDPELKYTSGGKAFTKISVAVKRPFTTDKVDFIDITFWEKKAETVAEYFRKGHRILVQGFITTNTKDDKKFVSVTGTEFEFIETKESASNIGHSEHSETVPKKAGSTAGKNKAFGAANEYENDTEDEMEDEDENDFPF